MTTPKKPLTKNESAIQLGNILKGGGRGGGSKKGIIRKIKKLLKIGEKPSKVSRSAKIKEVQIREKKSLKNQKPDLSAKKPVKKRTDFGYDKPKTKYDAQIERLVKEGRLVGDLASPKTSGDVRGVHRSKAITKAAVNKVTAKNRYTKSKRIPTVRSYWRMERAIGEWKKKKGKK